MPQADISGEYRSDRGQSRFPRLKLQNGEKARVVVVSAPQTEFVHRLEAPNIVNMAPVYKNIRDRDGNEQRVVDTRWVSSPLCLGNFDTLRERGVDDKNCPACLAARDRPDVFRQPQPKYAVNILRYNLRPGGSWADIATPYGVNALVWMFGGKIMDKLIDIRSMGAQYDDIRTVDLLLECTDANFQKPYSNGEFLPAAPAVWLATDQTQQYTAQYLAANGATEEDLTALLGKRVKPDWMADDISRVIQRWDVVRAYESRIGGAPAVGQQGFGGESLQQGLGQVQQQYGGQGSQFSPNQQAGSLAGQIPPGPQGYAQQAPAAGVDMGLLGGGFQPPVPPPPPAPDYMAAAQQATANGQNPVVAAYETASAPPPPPPAQTVPPAAPSGAVTPPAPTPATTSGLGNLLGGTPPQGLAGLGEAMGKPAQNLAPPAPSAGTAPAMPPGGSWSFDDLKKAAGDQ